MSQKSNLEIKVGLFVTTALLCLTAFIWYISDFTFFEEGRTIQATFSFANGLKKSAPVRFAGVDSGLVEDIQVFNDEETQSTKVKVTLWVKDGIEVPIDSRVMINQLGLLGEKYVEIIPGESKAFIREGSVIKGVDPVATEMISQRVNNLVQKIDNAVDGVNGGILSEANRQAFQSMLNGIDDIVNNIKAGKGTIGRFVYDESLYTNLDEFTADLKNNPWKLLYKSGK